MTREGGLGHFKQAINYYEQSLSIAKEVVDRAGQVGVYGNLGNAYQGLDDFQRAIKHHELHLNIAKEVGDRPGDRGAYGNLRDFQQALKHHEKSLNIAKELYELNLGLKGLKGSFLFLNQARGVNVIALTSAGGASVKKLSSTPCRPIIYLFLIRFSGILQPRDS